MIFDPPNYRHVPTMIPDVHRHAEEAFHECIGELKAVIRQHGLCGHLDVSLLHKHGDIRQGLLYVEYFNTNHLIQVILSNELIGSIPINATPYSFYFRDGQPHSFECTTYPLDEFGYPQLSDAFLGAYNGVLRKHDLEDVFGFRFDYKSRLLGAPCLVEHNVRDVSITSLGASRIDADLRVAVRTAWTTHVKAECCSCHHCWGHSICHPHGCVMPSPWDELVYPIYRKMRAAIQLEDLEHRFRG